MQRSISFRYPALLVRIRNLDWMNVVVEALLNIFNFHRKKTVNSHRIPWPLPVAGTYVIHQSSFMQAELYLSVFLDVITRWQLTVCIAMLCIDRRLQSAIKNSFEFFFKFPIDIAERCTAQEQEEQTQFRMRNSIYISCRTFNQTQFAAQTIEILNSFPISEFR